MNMNLKRNGIILLCLLTAVFLVSGSLFGTVLADENGTDSGSAFEEWIAGLEEKDLIPKTSGTFLSLGDYVDSFAQMGYVRKIPLMETENFAISVHLTWDSGSRTPDTQTAGCGIIFNTAEGSADHMVVSVRMDGAVYITGLKYYTKLSYGKYYYGLPSVEGFADLSVIYNSGKVSVYLNDNFIGSGVDVPFIGNEMGLGILSGTNQDFGTRCKFENIQLYTWQDAK